MCHQVRIALVLAALTLPFLASGQKASSASKDDNSMVIVFRDGRQKTYLMSDIARIEFNTAKTKVAGKGQYRFLGKWRVGDGAGSTFYITLEEDGVARKSIGSGHGTWTMVGNEARISWDDGWHDAIRKAGNQFEKAAYGPGKTFTDDPDNVTKAENTEAQPL